MIKKVTNQETDEIVADEKSQEVDPQAVLILWMFSTILCNHRCSLLSHAFWNVPAAVSEIQELNPTKDSCVLIVKATLEQRARDAHPHSNA